MTQSIKLLVKREDIRIYEILLDAFIISILSAIVILSNDPSKFSSLFYHFLVATILLSIVFIVRYYVILRLSFILYLLCLTLLFFVHLFGQTAGGATRWIAIGGIIFQPSELFKFIVPLAILKYYRNRHLHLNLLQLVWPIVVITIPTVLILKQPDLGTAMIVFFTGLTLLYLLGLKRYNIYASMFFIILLLPTLWNFLYEYQRMRIIAFLFPNSFSALSYQVNVAIAAISEGGLWGCTQSSVYVPAGTTDFIFPLFANQFGFVGVVILFTLYYRLVGGILFFATVTKYPFKSALAGAYAFLIMTSFFINIFMVTGFFPVVGLPLPFMSYGGTALLVNMLVLALIICLTPQNDPPPKYPLALKLRLRQEKRIKKLIFFKRAGFLIAFGRVLYIYTM